MLRPLDEGTVDEALALLKRGFPNRPERYWTAAFARMKAVKPPDCPWPYGFLFLWEEAPAGIILTLASDRWDEEKDHRTVVNLSSWYVDEKVRCLANRMLKRVIEFHDSTFTDLTATSSVSKINKRLGFTPWTSHTLYLFLPAALLTPRRKDTTVTPLYRCARDAIGPATRMLLEKHAELGCETPVLVTKNGCHPLVFVPARRKGIPVVRLIYAEDRRAVLENIGAVARFLLRKGFRILVLDGEASERPPGVVYRKEQMTWYRGKMNRLSTDYAFSEYVSVML